MAIMLDTKLALRGKPNLRQTDQDLRVTDFLKMPGK
jgi:hypothetical protein